jgi:hypothetical protein
VIKGPSSKQCALKHYFQKPPSLESANCQLFILFMQLDHTFTTLLAAVLFYANQASLKIA